VFFINKYINKILILSLIFFVFYNIFSILIIFFSPKFDGYLVKSINYLPYKYSVFFKKPLKFSKKFLQVKSSNSKKIYLLLSATEKKSLLDYTYWEMKTLYQITNKDLRSDFENDFINYAILSKNNVFKQKSIKLFYLRNITRFNKEVGKIILYN
tara:strand:+ start:411 stop:875 length:465 start_codon:yes stop_codon:yes gene_type:complete